MQKKKPELPTRLFSLTPVALALMSLPAFAQQDDSAASDSTNASPVVVTATRIEQRSFDLPAAINSLDLERIQETARAEVNISEQLNQVPGTVVQSRESYAQEQQISVRGFGARSQFGTRGIKLLADGIPVSTPDGQGNPGLFDLQSAQRIEVLRGPFSALYGNHSGGVVQVFTEDGPKDPTLTMQGLFGSYGTWKGGVKFGADTGAVNGIGSYSHFSTDGYRDHSAAEKDQFNAKLRVTVTPDTRVTFLVNYLNQPNNQDPLGLTEQQVEEDPTQSIPESELYNTRRNLDNIQAGAVLETNITAQDVLRLMAYAGNRDNDGFLAIAPGIQNNIRQSGGVSVLDRNFSGVGVRWSHIAERVTFSVGADYDNTSEDRTGYLNFAGTVGSPTDLGNAGALKRDEKNSVKSYGIYAQGELQATEKLSASAGVRYTKVKFNSQDNFICTTTLVTAPGAAPGTCSGSTATIGSVVGGVVQENPDDSGSVDYSAFTPVAGLLYRLTPTANLYANIGRSFETPTFIELAYQAAPDASGPNLGLDPSRSTHYEVGAKLALGSDTRMEVSVFHIDTKDEIVVLSNRNGRQSFQNADGTTRTGVELALDSRLGRGFSTLVSFTYLDAKFSQSFTTCVSTPCIPGTATGTATVDKNNKIPGVAPYNAYAELAWAHAPVGLSTALEFRAQGKMYVNDINSQTSDAFYTFSLRAGLEQRPGSWRLSEFVRVDNLLDEDYVSGIAVNDANGRFYYPAAGRNFLAGVSASYAF